MINLIFSEDVLASFSVSFLENESNTAFIGVCPDRLSLSGSTCLMAWTND